MHMSENNEAKQLSKQNTGIIIVNENTIREKIYIIRGLQVMLDFELAGLYGYTTSSFNQQVKRNEDKFPEDFRFQLTDEEYKILLSQNVTASWGGDRRTNPWAFTESGIYMLMTVLRGNMATKQSIALIRTFRAMKDYIIQNQPLLEQHKYFRMIVDSQKEIKNFRNDLNSYGALLMEHDEKLIEVMERLNNMVEKSELSPLMLDFGRAEIQREFLFMDGQPMKADVAYINIYSQAQKSIHIVDDYIATKTLHLLQDVKRGVKVTIFSDNIQNKLTASDYTDFRKQFHGMIINFKRTMGKIHDRFVILDYDTPDERVFHCGPSSKDAGNKLAAITEFSDGDVKKAMHNLIANMIGNPDLRLL